VGGAARGWKLSRAATDKAVFFSFPPAMEMESKVDLVRATSGAQAKQLDGIAAGVERAMKENPGYAEWARKQAAQLSNWVSNVREQAKSETNASREDAEKKVSNNADSTGFEGKCRLASKQLNAEAKGLDDFDKSGR
jgi:hypothetical protein